MKVMLAIVLSLVSIAANAVQVFFVSHNWTMGSGAIYSRITDGSHTEIGSASTAIWDWDGTTLTSTGLYSAVFSINSSPSEASIWADNITDLTIDTSTASPAATTAYVCENGTFLATLGHGGCGGHNFGANGIDESTTVWGPGLAVSRTLGGDDVDDDGGPRTIWENYNFTLMNWDGTALAIGTGIAVGSQGGEAMVFTTTPVPVPAAAWLFGSALGLLGWMRRRAS